MTLTIEKDARLYNPLLDCEEEAAPIPVIEPVSVPDVKKQILVVDDDPLIARLLKEPLEKAGFSVKVASHGLEALQTVKDRRPDLIILDILMPMLDGFKTARLLKFDKRFKEIPIIVLTSRATEGERKIGEQVGANEFLLKPFRLPQVLEVVKRYLNA
jgi:chemosensory pili system protein ChpA (sensor histidine kinase/response regulator)